MRRNRQVQPGRQVQPSRRVGPSLQVLRAGALTTVQDRGRPGYAHLGVPPSGALDVQAYELANRLVGNNPASAALELTAIGPTLALHSTRAHHIALTGAPMPMWVDGVPADLYSAVPVRPGQQIEIGAAVYGMRSYLAVAGGVQGGEMLGSLSVDLLSGLGGEALRAGSTVPIGWPGPMITTDCIPIGLSEQGGAVLLHAVAGPRLDWLSSTAASSLTQDRWTVTADSNRVGLRLAGPALSWAAAAELPSEGTVTGSVQVPPNGQPVIFLNDHPVTGGYPVVAVLTDDALAAAAQLRPGTSVGFRLTAGS